MGYFGKAWHAYRDNIVRLAGIGVAAVLLMIGLEIMKMGIFISYVALFANILAYKVIESKIGWKATAVQAFWAWIAQLLISIGAIVAVILFIALGVISGSVGIAIGVIGALTVLTLLLRFIFIPYFAHRGYSVLDMIRKSWQRGWNSAIVVSVEVLAVMALALLVAGAILIPVGIDAIHAMKAAFAQAQITTPNAAMSILHKVGMQLLLSPRNLALEILAIIAYGAITPLSWLIIYFGAKGGENEARVGEATKEMA